MANKRYRAVEGQGLTSHPLMRAAGGGGFVGYRRVIDKSEEPGDFLVPGGHRWRRMPDGEVLPDSAYLRKAVRQGALEELPLELPPPSASAEEPPTPESQPANALRLADSEEA